MSTPIGLKALKSGNKTHASSNGAMFDIETATTTTAQLEAEIAQLKKRIQIAYRDGYIEGVNAARAEIAKQYAKAV